MSVKLLVAGSVLLYGVSVGAVPPQTVRLKEQCSRDRCVYYEPSGRRIGSVTRDDTGRLEVRDSSGVLQSKVRETPDGTYEITRSRRRR